MFTGFHPSKLRLKAKAPRAVRFLFPKKPDFALYYQLMLLNFNGTALTIGAVMLWNWQIGILVPLFLLTSALVLGIAHRATNLAFDALEGQRDEASRESHSLRMAIGVMTDASIEGDEESGCECRYCGSKHKGLMSEYRFHPQLHNKGCKIPVLRSKIELIDLELPDDI